MLGYTLPYGFAKSIALVRGAAILAGWALMLGVFLGFFGAVTGVLGYVAFTMDEISIRQAALAESQHSDSLMVTRHINALRDEIKALRRGK